MLVVLRSKLLVFSSFALAEQDLFQRHREKNLEWESFQTACPFCPGGDFVGAEILLVERKDSGRREKYATVVDEPKACPQSYRLSCETRAVGSSS
jgi:hypothetical protein